MKPAVSSILESPPGTTDAAAGAVSSPDVKSHISWKGGLYEAIPYPDGAASCIVDDDDDNEQISSSTRLVDLTTLKAATLTAGSVAQQRAGLAGSFRAAPRSKPPPFDFNSISPLAATPAPPVEAAAKPRQPAAMASKPADDEECADDASPRVSRDQSPPRQVQQPGAMRRPAMRRPADQSSGPATSCPPAGTLGGAPDGAAAAVTAAAAAAEPLQQQQPHEGRSAPDGALLAQLLQCSQQELEFSRENHQTLFNALLRKQAEAEALQAALQAAGHRESQLQAAAREAAAEQARLQARVAALEQASDASVVFPLYEAEVAALHKRLGAAAAENVQLSARVIDLEHALALGGEAGAEGVSPSQAQHHRLAYGAVRRQLKQLAGRNEALEGLLAQEGRKARVLVLHQRNAEMAAARISTLEKELSGREAQLAQARASAQAAGRREAEAARQLAEARREVAEVRAAWAEQQREAAEAQAAREAADAQALASEGEADAADADAAAEQQAAAAASALMLAKAVERLSGINAALTVRRLPPGETLLQRAMPCTSMLPPLSALLPKPTAPAGCQGHTRHGQQHRTGREEAVHEEAPPLPATSGLDFQTLPTTIDRLAALLPQLQIAAVPPGCGSAAAAEQLQAADGSFDHGFGYDAAGESGEAELAEVSEPWLGPQRQNAAAAERAATSRRQRSPKSIKRALDRLVLELRQGAVDAR